MNKMDVQVKIDGKTLTVPEGLSVQKAALNNGIYIPGLCGHPDLPLVRDVKWSEKVYRGDEVIVGDFEQETAGDDGNCNLCLVAVEGQDELVRACETKVTEGMAVRTHGDDINNARREALSKILAHHPHACLTCAQKEGCSLTECSTNVPEEERCCILLNRCELGKVVEYVGLPEGTPKYLPEGFPKLLDDPFFDRDYNLCIGCLRCVRICNDVRGVQALAATFKDGRVWVGTAEKGALKDSFCRYCGACVEVCPTGALQDKSDSRPVHRGELAPCVEACPAGIDIPAYIRRISRGDFTGALQVIYNRVPFPGILGYVCFHPCEEACKRITLDDNLAICALKRFAYENALREKIRTPQKAEPTGKKVAIIGAGPSGLTAAYYLARAGHEVEVFDALPEPGGMLRYAIPEYRLPESVLDDELKVLYDLGIVFKMGARLGENFQLNELLEGEFSAVLLAIGASDFRELNIPGENLSDVIQALDLLRSVRLKQAPKLFGKVIVIGGGNVVVDAAMTARRLGADDVTMVCLEQKDEMPAHPWELEQATAEGIKIKPGWGPVKFLGDNEKLEKILFKRCTAVFDEHGQFNPQYDEGNTFNIEANYAIIAIGQQVDRAGLTDEGRLKIGPAGTFTVDPETLATDIHGVLAAGDDVFGPSSVIDAVASGRKAADSIDKILGGKGIESEPAPDEVRDDPYLGRDVDFHRRQALRPKQLDPEQRVKGFAVIEQAFFAQDAESEALRCLMCNLRAAITPVVLPPDKWQSLTVGSLAEIPSAEGVYQIADSDKKVIKIAGTPNLRTALEEECQAQPDGSLFCWEEDRMYSQRESELIQQYLQQYGEMPGGGADDLDDLF